ncbi:extracellular solute-binding protein, partial [Brachybacterium sp. AOP42-B2-9]|uniref:extracellular solute-binding protein n=1 Tax=Brachybacterium sp. AOP42-B2-9 TaxID=3457672 RepID=UPI004034BEC9
MPENVEFSPGAFDGEATIRVLGWQERQFMDEVFQAFAEAYPSITVEYETVPIDQLSGVISSRIQAGEGAMDVYMADQPLVAS